MNFLNLSEEFKKELIQLFKMSAQALRSINASTILAEVNAHPRDEFISFQEEGHIYTLTGKDEHPVSMTTLIHQYFQEFDADKIIRKMMAKPTWPQSPYYGKTPEQIKAQWEQNRVEAADLGTQMHLQIEEYFNGQLETIPETPEFQQFLKFWSDLSSKYPEMKPYRTEWFIYDEDKMVAGSIDFCLANDKGEIIILDWKRSKEIKFENPFGKGKGPLAHLDDCNFHHYSLQLNGYRYILENKYGKRVVGMYLAVFHPNQTSYQFIQVPDRSLEIQQIWALHSSSTV